MQMQGVIKMFHVNMQNMSCGNCFARSTVLPVLKTNQTSFLLFIFYCYTFYFISFFKNFLYKKHKDQNCPKLRITGAPCAEGQRLE